jgi:hypothetical protein
MVYMDQNGDAEGNYTLVARKSHHILPQQYGLYPVGVFTLKENDNRILVSMYMLITDSSVSSRISASKPRRLSGRKLFPHLVSALNSFGF